MSFLKFIKKWSPQRVFFADASGALITTSILAFALAPLHTYLALPKYVFYSLAGMAALLFLYSISIALVKPKNWPIYLKIIALANFLYCPVTWFFLFREGAGLYAFIYFTGETTLIAAIALSEWKYAIRFQSRKFVERITEVQDKPTE